MGYTHYFTMKKKPATDEVWGKLCNITNALIEASTVKLCGGDGDNLPEIDEDGIWFNGDRSTDEEFETFFIERVGRGDSFCKTGRKPYDELVVAVLMVAERLKILAWSSDGEGDDFINAKILLDSLK